MDLADLRHYTARRQLIGRVVHVRHRYDGAWCDLDIVASLDGYLDLGVTVAPHAPVTCFWCLAACRLRVP